MTDIMTIVIIVKKVKETNIKIITVAVATFAVLCRSMDCVCVGRGGVGWVWEDVIAWTGGVRGRSRQHTRGGGGKA